jgi:thiol:disulfide interchange protein
MSPAAKRWTVYGTLIAAVIVLMFLQAWPANDRVPWRTDLRAALDDARADDRRALVYFYADWCPPCQRLAKTVFSHEPTAQRLADAVVPIKADVTSPDPGEAQAFHDAWGVQALPTMILFDAQGREISRHVGTLDRGQLIAWVTTLVPPGPTR